MHPRTRSCTAAMLCMASVVGGVMAVTLLSGIGIGHAGEIVPSVGLTKPINGDSRVTTYGGVAFRGDLAPLVMTEIGVSYRNETRNDGLLKVRMWPVTASLYLTPLPMLYAGGGVGWYHTTYDYASSVPIQDETRQDFGVHLGGGLKVPLGAGVGVDLSGRYVMMRDQQSRLIPSRFDPDFWMTSMGLAIRF